MFSRYLIADYERRNFSVSQCSWNPGAQENIVAIKSPTIAEMKGKSDASTSTTALSPGDIAGIIVGSIVGLLFIVFLAFVGKRKFTKRKSIKNLDTDFHGKPELAANNAPFLDEDEISKAKGPELDGGNNAKQEIENCIYLGAELEAGRDVQELKGNEGFRHELATSNLEVSELPS